MVIETRDAGAKALPVAVPPTRAADSVLGAALVKALDAALSAVAPGRHPDHVAIHEFRKAIKRYRALLRLIEPDREAAAVRREASALAREVAGARDLTAALLALDDLSHRRLLRAEAGDLRAAIDARRADGERQQLDDAMRARIGGFIAAARAGAERAPALSTRALIERLARHYGHMRRAGPDDWTAASAEALHELRKAVVIHRYQMELVRPLWPRAIDLWVAEAQRLRERLGQHQDLETLALAAAEVPVLDLRRRARLMTALRKRQADLREAAAKQHARLTAEKPKAFAARLLGIADSARTAPERDEAEPAPGAAERS